MNVELNIKPFQVLEKCTPFEFAPESVSFLRGDQDDRRIRLQYYHDGGNSVHALVQFGLLAQGPPGAAHGGAIAAVFDELMGATCWALGIPALTAQFTTRYFSKLPLQRTVLFTSQIHKQDGDAIKLKASVTDEKGNRFAEAKGLFIALDKDKLQALFPQAGEQMTNQEP